MASPADIVIYGGAAGGGKSWAMLIEPLRHLANAGFGAVIFRRTCPEIMNEGGLWQEAEKIYPGLGGEAKLGNMSWTFATGSRVQFGHLDHETDKLKWQGSQIALIEFDELTHFSESQFFYMLSRNRSTCGVRPYVRASCNPDADSWVAELIAWWIDPSTGYPIPERSGVVRWFVRDQGQIAWGGTKEELLEKYPDSSPKSLTFISARLDDNPALCEADPGYRANLLALPYVDRERLLGGNWKVRSREGSEWPGEYFDNIEGERWPDAFESSAMAIDPSKGRERGDPSAIVFVGLCSGTLWVDASIAVRPVPSIVSDAIEMYLEHQPSEVALESNAFQDLMANEFDRACEDMGAPPLPISLYDNRVNKQVRIRRLGSYLKRDKIRFRPGSTGCKTLESQMRGFPLPDVHDDGPDALEMAVRLLNQLFADSQNNSELEILVQA